MNSTENGTPRPPPPPEPQAPPTAPGTIERRKGAAGLDSYHHVAETVGMLPSIRVKDNVVQAVTMLVCCLLGAGVGWLLRADLLGEDVPRAALIVMGAVAGVVVGLLVSGVVLMVLGWVRVAKGNSRTRL